MWSSELKITLRKIQSVWKNLGNCLSLFKVACSGFDIWFLPSLASLLRRAKQMTEVLTPVIYRECQKCPHPVKERAWDWECKKDNKVVKEPQNLREHMPP